MIGRTLGNYEVVDKLGAGGMGEVYRARDRKLQRDVAIKVLPAELAADAERLGRLQREARLLAAIDHPNINAIYAVEEVEGTHFLVLQLVEGVTLADRLGDRGSGLPIDEALRIASQVAEALEAAHGKGIVHRDLKPANVMVGPEGRVKVLDFGIAKASTGPVASDDVTRSELTRAGMVVGTTPYMSPEQLRGDVVDARSDIWAFGCLLYEMLAGARAFGGGTAADTSAAVIARDPDWDALPDEVPTALVQLLERCLHKDRNERVQAMAEVRVELRELIDGSRPPGSAWSSSTPVAAPAPRRVRWSVYVAAAVFVAVVAWVQLVGPGDDTAPSGLSFRISNQLLATVGPGAHSEPTLSPDGATMAFVSNVSGVPQIYVQTLTEGATPIAVTDESAPARRPSWSPTGGEIVFHRPNNGIWSVGALGSPPPRRIIEEGRNPSFSADGTQIVYERMPTVWIADADGTNQRPVDGATLLMPTAIQYVANSSPALSPDGSTIVYFRMASGPMGDLWTVPATGGEPRRLTFDTNQASDPIWSPDGQHVLFSSLRSGSRTLWRIPAAGGEPVPVTTGAGEDGAPALSADGRRLVYANVRNEKAMMIYDPAVDESREIAVRRYGLVLPRFSSDGASIAFFSEVAGGTEVFVVNANGEGMRQVTSGDNQFNIHPRWAADGSSLYFYRDNPYRESSPGDFLKVPLAGGPGDVVLPDFYWDRYMHADVNPDETAVAYVANEPPATTVVRNLATDEERVLQPVAGWESESPFHLALPRWSPDGLSLLGNDEGEPGRAEAGLPSVRVWVCASTGACEAVVDGFFPVWSGDGSQIYFARPSATPGLLAIWVVDRDGRNSRPVTEVGPLHPITPLFDVAPDGRIVWIQDRPGQPEIWSAEIE